MHSGIFLFEAMEHATFPPQSLHVNIHIELKSNWRQYDNVQRGSCNWFVFLPFLLSKEEKHLHLHLKSN